MFVRNVIKDERQHEYSMHITSIVGINIPKRDTIDIMEWYCVSIVTMDFITNINLKL